MKTTFTFYAFFKMGNTPKHVYTLKCVDTFNLLQLCYFISCEPKLK